MLMQLKQINLNGEIGLNTVLKIQKYQMEEIDKLKLKQKSNYKKLKEQLIRVGKI